MHEELMEKENHAFFYFNVGIFILSVKENSFVTIGFSCGNYDCYQKVGPQQKEMRT